MKCLDHSPLSPKGKHRASTSYPSGTWRLPRPGDDLNGRATFAALAAGSLHQVDPVGD